MTGYKNPPRRRTPEFHLQDLYTTLAPLAEKYAQGMTWREIGAEIGVSGAVVYRAVVKGIEPHNNAIRQRLGFPLRALAPLCPKCGVVHVRKTCPSPRKTRRPSRTKRRKVLWRAPSWLAMCARKLAQSRSLKERIDRALAYDYQAWRAAHQAELERIVAWAEERGRS